MTPCVRVLSSVLVAVSVAVQIPAGAETGQGSTTKQSQDGQAKPPPKATYGLCSLPQNADASPSRSIPVIKEQCHNSQTFFATSPTANYGGSCGFTVAFGQIGDLQSDLWHVSLIAEWGDVPLTATTCPNARLAAQAWGERCLDPKCASLKWEKIGGPKQISGSWHAVSQTCSLLLNFGSKNPDKRFRTLNVEVVTTLIEDGKAVRKRAKGRIRAEIPNGKCPKYDKKYDPPPKKL